MKAKLDKRADIKSPVSRLKELDSTTEISDSNIFSINKVLMKLKHSEIYELEAVHGKSNFRVDLKEGKIYVNDEPVDLELDEKLLENCKKAGFRWINFRRHKISYVMGGRAQELTYHGIGWQSTVNGKNIQRFLLIDEQTGKWTLEKKR